MREITRCVKVAVKRLIAVVLVDVDLPYWTSKVEHLIAFRATGSNICRSIRRPRFPIRVQNFGEFGDVLCWFLHSIFWMSAIFLLPVCLTYWPRKYATRVDPHVDNSHQVWSWYDHTLPSYTSRDFVTLTFDLLNLNSCCAWWVRRSTLLPSLKTLSLSVLDLWVITFPLGYHW